MVFENTEYISIYSNKNKGVLVPKGSIILMPMPNTVFDPPGFFRCDGRTLQIVSYPDLYDIIGISFGGDGSTTFNLPDLQSRFLYGKGNSSGEMNHTIGNDNMTLTTSYMPSHTHTLSTIAHSHTGFESELGNQVDNDDFNNSNNGTGPCIVGGGRQQIGSSYGIGLDNTTVTITIGNSGQSSPDSFSIIPQHMLMIYLIKY